MYKFFIDLFNYLLLFFLKINHDSVATAINLLTRVSGIGPAKAKELVDQGVRTIEDLEHHKEKLTHQQLIGLQYFKDFETKIPRQEVEDIKKIIRQQIGQLDDSYISMHTKKLSLIFANDNKNLNFGFFFFKSLYVGATGEATLLVEISTA